MSSMASSVHPCGCVITERMGGGGIVAIVVCSPHGRVEAVRRCQRALVDTLAQVLMPPRAAPDDEPEPPRAA